MTDLERIIKNEQRRLDELSKPEIWARYTKNMEGGELRDFTQSYRDSQTIVAALLRTAEHDKAMEEGRLVELPCKVGDTVYLTTRGFVEETKVRTFFVGHPSYNRGEPDPGIEMIRLTNFDVPLKAFGKTVFLTRAEAEAVLDGGGDGV